MNIRKMRESLDRLFELEECVRAFGEMQDNHYVINSICSFSNSIHHERKYLERLAREELNRLDREEPMMT